MSAFSRSVDVTMDWLDPSSFEIRGALKDNVHSLTARFVVSFPDFVIREATGDIPGIRIARWTVARGMRSLGRLDEAESMQRALADELAAAGAPDGFAFEELAEIALARGDRAAAQRWAAKAIALLGADPDLKASGAGRLARLAELAKPAAATH